MCILLSLVFELQEEASLETYGAYYSFVGDFQLLLYFSLSLSLFLSSLVEAGDMLSVQPQFRSGSNQPQYSKDADKAHHSRGPEVPYPIILSKPKIMSLSIARPSPLQSCAPLSASTGRSLS